MGAGKGRQGQRKVKDLHTYRRFGHEKKVALKPVRQVTPMEYLRLKLRTIPSYRKKVLLKLKYKTNEYGCKLSLLTPSKNDGYCQPTVEGKKPSTVHTISFWDKTEGEELLADEDVSHLCHQRQCFNPEHIVRESKLRNQQRKGCLVHVRDVDNTIRLVCKHTPRCIRTHDVLELSSCPVVTP